MAVAQVVHGRQWQHQQKRPGRHKENEMHTQQKRTYHDLEEVVGERLLDGNALCWVHHQQLRDEILRGVCGYNSLNPWNFLAPRGRVTRLFTKVSAPVDLLSHVYILEKLALLTATISKIFRMFII